MSVNQTQSSGANNPFISIFDALANTIQQSSSIIGSQVLPVWVAKQLNLEQQNQLFQPTIDRRQLPPILDIPSPSRTIQNTGGITGTKTGDLIVIGGLVAIGAIILLKA